jgi:hypothetical protein
MTEPDPTGYNESPDTLDGPAAEPVDAAQGDAALTTDDQAQQDDGVVRPGNQPD